MATFDLQRSSPSASFAGAEAQSLGGSIPPEGSLSTPTQGHVCATDVLRLTDVPSTTDVLSAPDVPTVTYMLPIPDARTMTDAPIVTYTRTDGDR